MTTIGSGSSSITGKPIKVACLGGGQLGRMMALEAPRINVQMSFLDPKGSTCPASQVSQTVVTGSLHDAESIRQIAAGCDVLTVEIEHVGVETLEQLEQEGVNVQPSAQVLKIIRDKYSQKIKDAGKRLGFPIMLKARQGAYDGKGNAVLDTPDDQAIAECLSKLGCNNITSMSLYAEGWIDFDCEVAVMVAKSATETAAYPAVNAIQQDSICRVVLAPARNISTDIRQKCEALAKEAIDSLGKGASGMFGVELFITKKGSILLNEVAPRPHNTGHYTQDACVTNQFEQHLRGICGFKLGSTDMLVEAAGMVNVLGADTMEETLKSSNAALAIPRAVVHWYGKDENVKGRKMGHINMTGNSHVELDTSLRILLELEGIPLSVLTTAATPLVGVIMGSHSDLPTMTAAVEALRIFGISYEVDIVSAHRTPEKLMQYSREAADRGLCVIIAGAGGAAHLPGMVAAMTPLPVIGVPVKTSTLSGVDSLYSIVQMPRGVPVATVAIGNAMNAGLLAVRILSTSRPELRQKMIDYQTDMTQKVNDMSTKLLELGPDSFLEELGLTNTSVNV